MTTGEMSGIDRNSLTQILEGSSSIDGAVLYGSVARGDVEEHSDIDLLLLCPPSQKQRTFGSVQQLLNSHFNRLSVTVYTAEELTFLWSMRSLFLLHLSREGVLLFDKSGFLASLLGNFEPRDSYRGDFEKSLQLTDPLRTVVKGSPNNLHRLSYVYSLFRVFGVYLLADRRVFEFSKSRMAQLLVETFPAQRDSLELLSALRALNSNFFTGGLGLAIGQSNADFLVERITALGTLVGSEIPVTSMSYQEAVRRFVSELGTTGRALDYRLRMWFLLLAYDGLNLHCLRSRVTPLTNLSEPALRALLHKATPPSVCSVVEETISYLHRYPLKYFLAEDSKIGSRRAQTILEALVDDV